MSSSAPREHLDSGARLCVRAVLLVLCALLFPVLGVPAAFSQETQGMVMPELQTNQHFIEEIAKAPAFDVEDQMAVFEFIFSSLPTDVSVYPTENYYYFKFYYGGILYAGNLRLAAVDRDKGILHFAYFPDANMSSSEGDMHYKQLSAEDGVSIEKAGPLEYKVGFGRSQVTFHLNDLSDVKPPKGLLRDDESYIGPIFDESGVQFFLVFNMRFKLFHYILNETWGEPDQFVASGVADRIVIGKRTGFAFYQDHFIDRKILIAVHGSNVVVNNYFDGPFDQLPDNFIEGDVLKNAIEESDPSVAGKLDRFGYITGSEGRYLVGPYLQYTEPNELLMFDTCANSPEFQSDEYPRCFSVQGGGQ